MKNKTVGVKQNAILDRAQNDTDLLLKKAKDKVDSWISLAKKQGHEQGYAKAENLKAKLEKFKDQIYLGLKDDIALVSVGIAKKMLDHHFQQHPETVVTLAQNVLEQVEDSHEVVLRVNPKDVNILKKQMNL